MAGTLSMWSIISFVGAAISLVVAVFLWFLFDIPKVFGDLSGRTARKSIARMRAENEKSGSKTYKSSKTNVARGKITEPIEVAKKMKKKSVSNPEINKTGLLLENQASSKDISRMSGEETTALLDSSTTELLTNDNQEERLEIKQKAINRKNEKQIKMLEEVILIHTQEVIE